ncbi:MAG: hypothetical protein ACYCS1_05475 [Gammaproteobacteria bacterium]
MSIEINNKKTAFSFKEISYNNIRDMGFGAEARGYPIKDIIVNGDDHTLIIETY